MLILSRKEEERIVISVEGGPQIEILVSKIKPGKVSLGIDAPPEVTVARGELADA